MKSLLAFLTSLTLSVTNFVFPQTPPVPKFSILNSQFSISPTPITFHQYPSSNISVNWGSLAPNFTIYMEPDMKPCDHLERSITITNHGLTNRQLTIRGTKTAEEKNFSQVLDIKIFKDNALVYGPKTLKQFFIESMGVSGVPLGSLAGNSTSTYKIVVDFPCAAGNEYQRAKLVFNLKIGKILTLPPSCQCTCYQHGGARYIISLHDRRIYADFSDGDKVSCPSRPSCAQITN